MLKSKNSDRFLLSPKSTQGGKTGEHWNICVLSKQRNGTCPTKIDIVWGNRGWELSVNAEWCVCYYRSHMIVFVECNTQ